MRSLLPLLALGVALALLGARCGPASKPRIVGYYASWSIYERDYHVADVPAERLTHLAYAFAGVSAGGECVLTDPWADVQKPYPGDPPDAPFRGNFRQLGLLKQAQPSLRTLISVGGWTGSTYFSDVAANAAARAAFAQSCVDFVRQYGFDGIDLDWEYPVGGGLPGNVTRPEDRENFTSLLIELRSQLDAAGTADGKNYLLTVATPADAGLAGNFELDAIAATTNWLHLMVYDFAGGWSPTTAFQAALWDDGAGPAGASADDAVERTLAAGVPPRHIVLGLPFYGRGWQGVPNVNAGLYQPHAGVPMGTGEPGIFDFWDLADRFLGSVPSYWSSNAGVPWLYDPGSGWMISYDDAESIAGKSSYARERGLGGVMIWELSADDATDTLLTAAHEALNGG